MQVQGIKANTNFEAKRRNNVEDIETLVNLDDSQLRYIAQLNNQNSKKNKQDAKKANALFWAIPIVDTIASGVLFAKTSRIDKQTTKELIKTPLSSRAAVATGAGARWAGALGVIGIYSVAKKALVSNSKHLQYFEQNNPMASFLIDMGVLFTALTAGQRLLEKKLSKSFETSPEKTVDKLSKIGQKFTKLDETKFAKNTFPKIQKSLTNFVEKTPKLAKAGRFALANSVWILLGAGLLSSAHNSVKKSRRIEENYNQLKQTQFEAAKFLAARRELESEILAEKTASRIKTRPEPKQTKPIEEADKLNDID